MTAFAFVAAQLHLTEFDSLTTFLIYLALTAAPLFTAIPVAFFSPSSSIRTAVIVGSLAYGIGTQIFQYSVFAQDDPPAQYQLAIMLLPLLGWPLALVFLGMLWADRSAERERL